MSTELSTRERADQSAHYLFGFFTATIASAIRANRYGVQGGLLDRELRLAIKALVDDPYLSETTRAGALDTFGHHLRDEWLVVAANGEPQSLQKSRHDAEAALRDGTCYWEEAAACGHPSAPGYVDTILPLRIRPVCREEADMIREEHGVLTLDREP